MRSHRPCRSGPRRRAAAGIAQINAIGNIGGFVGTTLLGVIKDALPLALLSGIGCLLVLALGGRRRAEVTATGAG